MNALPLFHPSTGFTRSTSGPRAVQISTHRAQPIHLCSSTSGIIAIGIYYFTKVAYVRNYLNPTSVTKQCYKFGLLQIVVIGITNMSMFKQEIVSSWL